MEVWGNGELWWEREWVELFQREKRRLAEIGWMHVRGTVTEIASNPLGTGERHGSYLINNNQTIIRLIVEQRFTDMEYRYI